MLLTAGAPISYAERNNNNERWARSPNITVGSIVTTNSASKTRGAQRDLTLLTVATLFSCVLVAPITVIHSSG